MSALRKVLNDGLGTIDGAPGRAIRAAFNGAGRSQENAAELLGVPYGTFRRHLARGIEQLVDELWRRESAPRAK